jgi:aspartate kinase
MSIVVQKYGGSSVAGPEKLRTVAARVMATRAAGHDVCVVVSAMGDTTDELLASAKKLSADPPRRELDMLLSAGERISMALLSIAIRELGGDAISFTGSQSGIITTDRHSDARIIEVRPFRIQDELARGRIVVVAGYQGVSQRKEITTLGRGGSDTTAVALAAALNAEWCEICSDVDGVYSADPRVVSTARRLPEVGYEEMQEMAAAGARVLNAQAVEFAKEKGIAIFARAAGSPPMSDAAGTAGTVVRQSLPRAAGAVAAVVGESRVLALHATVAPPQVLDFLDAQGVSGKQIHFACPPGGPQTLTLVISCENLHNEEHLRAALAQRFSSDVQLVRDLGAVSAIGTGINATHQNVLRGSACLAQQGIDVQGLATSSFRITWLVSEARANDAVRALHTHFVESKSY